MAIGFALGVLCIVAGCKGEKPAPAGPAEAPAHAEADAPVDRRTGAPAIPDSLPYGLLLAFSQFGVVDGKATSKPGPARFDILTREDGEWKTEVVEDTQSNIFHKAMPFAPRGQPPGILTAAGTGAYVKLWHREKGKLRPTTLWHTEFGGEFNRIRDVEVADLDGDGVLEIVVATHDQGVVAILRQRPNNKWKAQRIFERKDTFIHEIEIGDLDGDGVLEVYATPTPPNRLFAPGQSGDVVRFVPKRNEGPTVVAALGRRHAKEIYVGDVDGDGVDELYVPVEALMTGLGANARMIEPVEIRRYDADTPPDGGIVVARIPDQHARFLTVGDVDGDGKKEMVVASFSTGLWLLRPGKNPKSEWGVDNIDRDSGGYEHAARFADLDGDGIDELYVADDKQGELRRYVWVNDRPKRTVIQKRDVSRSRMTWNIVEFERSQQR
ncbi:MAG: VCBS repeat-containing protein [Deltaproteobacteria bacterium]|nr:VCBS repeat-containing protein [Deltaproteobacteria bacterium]